jgi:hypothetical protein
MKRRESDFTISMRPGNRRWRFKLDRPHSSGVCVLTANTRRSQRWSVKNLDECAGCYMWWVPRNAAGRFVRRVRAIGMTVGIELLPEDIHCFEVVADKDRRSAARPRTKKRKRKRTKWSARREAQMLSYGAGIKGLSHQTLAAPKGFKGLESYGPVTEERQLLSKWLKEQQELRGTKTGGS